MGVDALMMIGLTYCLLLIVVGVHRVAGSEKTFYSPTPPFNFGKAYKTVKKELKGFRAVKFFVINYALILGIVALSLSSLPLWWFLGIGSIADVFIWLVLGLILAYFVLALAWPQLYTRIDVEAEQALARAAEREQEQAALRAHYEAQQRLVARRREQEQREFEGRMQLEILGIAAVLDEPESPMSRFYVTETFTEYGDPLAPFREKFAPLTGVNLRELLEQSGAVPYDPAKTIDVEPSSAAAEAELDQLELLPPPKTTTQPKRRLEILSKVREEAVLPPSDDASPAQAPNLPRVEGHIAEHLWDNLRTDWCDVLDSPVAKTEGSTTPSRGRYVPEQLVLSEALLEATLGGRPAGLKAWRYRGRSVLGMLLLDLETAERYPELRAWLQKPENRERLLDLETARDDLETLGLDLSVNDVEYGEGPVGGWRAPTLALTERAWILAIGFVPAGEATTSRGVKEPLRKIELPVDW
jgi:hypothetical protein